jgi:hypothetical protein
VAAVALASFVIVTAMLSGVGGPASPVGTASAGFFENCQFSDSLTFAVGASLGLSNQDCAFWTPDEDSAEIAETDLKASLETSTQYGETFSTSQNNFAQDRYSVMMAKAKISIINDLNNNVSRSQARANAKEDVRDYATNVQVNLLNQYETDVQQMLYAADTGQASIKYWRGSYTTLGTETDARNIRLADNETTFNYTLLTYNGGDIHIDPDFRSYEHIDIINNTGDSSPGWNLYQSGNWFEVDVNGTTYRFQETNSGVPPSTGGHLSQLGQDITRAEDNIDVLVNNTYDAYQAGEIDSTDLAAADPTTIGTQASTDYSSTGYYGYANAQLASLGLSGDTNASHVVSLDDTNRSVTGTVFYTGEDNVSFQTGTQYNPVNLNGSVYVTVSELRENGTVVNNTSAYLYVEENFTIESATNTKTGEPINSTTMETRNYSSTNVSDLQQEIQQLRNERDYYEEQASSSGGFGIDFGGTGTGIGVALAAVLVLMIATRN